MIRFNCPHCQREYHLPAALAGLPLVCKGCSQRFVPASLPPAPPLPAPPPPAPKIERSILPPPAPPAPAPAPKVQAPKPVAPKPEAPKVEAPPAPKPPAAPPPKADAPAGPGDDVLVSKADSTPDIDFNVGGPTAASLSDDARKRPKGLSSAEVALPTTGTDTDRDAVSVPDLDLEELAQAKARSHARLELPVPKSPPAEPRARTEPELKLPPAKPKPAPKPVPPAPAPEPEAEPAARSGLIPFAADLFALVVLLAGGMLVGELLVKKPTGAILADATETPLDALVWAAVPLTLALVYLLLEGRGRSLGALARGR